MSTVITDCLVLRIIENTHSTSRYDQEVFIIWDTLFKQYIIRGCRSTTRSVPGVPYSYTCTRMVDVLNFLFLIIDPANDCTFEIYNYDNLPPDSNNITFEFLSDCVEYKYEIVAYDEMWVDSSRKNPELVQALKSLRTVANEY